MRLPWVSRERLDAAERDIQRWQDAWTVSHQQFNVLFEKYHALAQPAVIHAVPHIPTENEKREPSPIAQTIRQEAAGDGRLSAYLWKRSRELKLEHTDWNDAQVAEQLASWHTAEDGLT